jgi:hypothetical protein
MFLCLFLFLQGASDPSGEKGAWARFILGGFVDYSFPTRLVLDAFTNDTTAVVYFLQIPLGLQKLDLSI